MNRVIITHPLDLKGDLTSNAVEHDLVLGNGKNRAFAFPSGPVYAESVRLYEATKPNVALERGKDYQLVLMHPALTKLCRSEIITAIVVHNPKVSTDVVVRGQIVGGPWGGDLTSIEAAINALELDTRVVDWSNLANIPEEFQTAPSYADVGDIFGFEYIVTALYHLTDAVKVGDNAAMDGIREVVEAMRVELREMFQEHIDSEGNVHELTPDQLGVPTKTDLRNEVQALTELINKLKARIGELEAYDTATSKKIVAINQSIETISVQIANLVKQDQRFNVLLSELSNEISEFNTVIGNINKRINVIVQELAETNEALNNATNRVTALEEALKALTNRVNHLEETGGAAAEQIAAHIRANDPHTNYLHKQKGGTVNASVHVNGNLTSRDDVRARA